MISHFRNTWSVIVSPWQRLSQKVTQKVTQKVSQKEQWLAFAALVTLLTWVVWQGLVIPLTESQALAEKKLATSRAQLSLIQHQAEQILSLKAAGAKARPISNAPVDQVVHQLAGKYQLVIQRVSNRGELLDIDLVNTRFDRLMDWLTALEQQHQIKVRNILLESTETSGFVEVRRLQLARG